MGTSHQKSVLFAAIAACAAFSVSSTQAATTWTGLGTTANFSDSGNWDNGLPTSGVVAVFPSLDSVAKQPIFDNTVPDAVLGLDITNKSGGVQWKLDKHNTSTNDRSISIYGDGIKVAGGGTASLSPTFIRLQAAQTWNVATDTTLNLFLDDVSFAQPHNAQVTGAFKITKTGDGKVVFRSNSAQVGNTAFTGGIDITGGTVVNNFSTNGVGTGAVHVYSTGTYQALNAINAGQIITLHGGGTLQGSGSGSGISGTNALLISSDATGANKNVTISTAGNASDVFAINATTPFQGGAADTVTTFKASNNSMIIVNGTGNGYLGSFVLESGTLRFGNSAAVLGSRPLTLGANTKLSLGTQGATSANDIDTALTFDGDATIELDRPSSGAVPSSPFDLSAQATANAPVSGARTISVVRGANISSGSPTLKFMQGLAIKSDIKIDAGANTIVSGGAVVMASGASGAFSLTKTGDGTLSISSSSNYSGVTSLKKGSLNLATQNQYGATTGISFDKGTNLNINDGSITSSNINFTFTRTGNVPIAYLRGDGTINIGGGGSSTLFNRTLVVTGSSLGSTVVTPGDDGAAGVMDVNGSINFTTANSVWPDLVINVTKNGIVAGDDYSRLAVTGNLSGWANVDLIVNLSPGLSPAFFEGKTLDIITVLGTASFNTDFHSFTVNGGTANLLRGDKLVQLSQIVPVPEPTSLAGLALVGLGLMARRRKMA